MGRCKPWPTPLRRVADRGIAKARFCFRPPATGLCIGFRYADPMIFLAVERAHVYASHIRWTGHPEQKVMPVGQKLRETMTGVLSPLLRHLLRPPASRRNPIQRPVARGRKQNRTFAIPRSATRRRGVGQCFHRPIFHVDSFQRLMSEESKRLAVGGPEGRET